MPILSPPNPNTFANSPLDRAGHRRKDPDWIAAALASPDARICAVRGDALFLEDRGPAGLAPVWLSPAALSLADPAAPHVFLGVDPHGAPHFAVRMTTRDERVDQMLEGLGEFTDLRLAAPRLQPGDAAVLGCAKSMLDWHARHRFCAACGARSTPAEAGWKRACSDCGAEHFPRVDPVVIMLVVRDGKALLGRQERFPAGMFSALAGFVEPGESLEEAVAREVAEEVGLKVSAVAYAHTQPWPFPSQLMIAMIAEAEPGEVVLEDEISGVVWLTREDARAALSGGVETDQGRVFAPPPFAIAHHLLQTWVDAPEV